MADDKNSTKATGGAKAAKDSTAKTKAETKGQTAAVPAGAEKATNAQNSVEQGTGGQVSGLAPEGENQATGTPGGESGNQVKEKETEKAESKTKSEKRRNIAKEVFASRGIKTVYFTSDMIPFRTEQDAKAHAATLTDKTVTTQTSDE